MGTSTDAILFYGYAWGDEGYFPPTKGGGSDDEEDEDLDEEDDKGGWEDRLAEAHGLKQPIFPSHVSKLNSCGGWDTDHEHPDYKAWSLANKEYTNECKILQGRYGCLCDQHCSDRCPTPFVAIAGSVQKAYRGHIVEVPVNDMSRARCADWTNQLNEFCRVLDIDLSEAKGPGWFLVSWWG